ncbi:MAG: energy transducer TonB [Melioribacteraceae bacterium]|nr:energy transducer TonB [Melioribacteraceae bacterium]
MKNMIIIVIIILVALSCKENKIEVVNNELEYYQIEELNPTISKSDIIGNLFTTEIKNFIKNLNKQYKETLIMLKAEYNLFVDMDGRVEKIKPLTKSSVTRIEPSQIILSNIKELTDYLVEFFGKTSLPIGYKDGKKVKYIFSFHNAFYINKDDGSIAMDTLKDINADEIKKSDLFLIDVENKPGPIGGMQSIFRNVKYPEIAKRAGVQGKVLVRAYIDEKGDIVKAEIIKGAHEALDSAAINAVLKTKFNPGIHHGKAVKTQVAIPIVFALK